jgi:hypothetical protein
MTEASMTNEAEFLRLLIPVAGFSATQRRRAVALGTRVELKVAEMIAKGADVDRVLGWVEGYFPEE